MFKKLLFFIFCSQLCHAQFSDLRINRYTVDDGLPFNRISCLKQDSRGYIWIGTENGLSCFNGFSFTNYYNEPNIENSLPSNIISSIAEDSAGNIWVSTFNGICKYNPKFHTFKKYPLRNAGNFATRLSHSGQLNDCNGNIFAINENSIWKYNYRTDSLEQIFPEKVKELADSIKDFTNIFCDSKNRLWVLSKANFAFLNAENGSYKCFASGSKYSFFANVVEDEKQNLYISAYPDGLLYYNIAEEKLTSLKEKITQNNDPEFAVNNILWKPTDRKKLFLSGLFFGYYEYDIETNKLKKNRFNDIYYNPILETGMRQMISDKQGNIWIGTNNGLFVAGNFPSEISGLNTNSFLQNVDTNVSDCIMLNDSVFFFLINYSKFIKWNLKSNAIEEIRVHDNQNRLARIKFLDNMLMHENEIWLTDQKFVACYNLSSGKWKLFNTSFKPKNVSVEEVCLGILFDHHNQLWMNSNLGIYKWNGNSFDEILLNEKNNSGNIKLSPHFRKLVLDANGFIWALRAYNWERGKICVTKINPSTYESFSYYKVENDKTSLPCDNDFFDLQIDKFNTVYVASSERIITFNATDIKPKFTQPDYSNCSFNFSRVYSVQLTDNELWSYADAGIFVLDINSQKVIKSFSGKDGLIQEPGSVYFFKSFFNDRILFAKRNFLYQIISKKENQSKPKPEIFLTEVLVKENDYKEYSRNNLYAPYIAEVNLKPGINDVTFVFSSMNYADIKNDRYSYVLDNFEKQWSTPSPTNQAVFDNLPPGNYVFKVKVKNKENVWSNTFSIPLIVEPFYYQTLWFKMTLAFIAAGIIFSAFLFRIRMLQKEVAQKLAFNKQLSEKEMQALRAQMNPHFVFNALNSINRYIIRSDKETASDYLVKFSKLMRLILENSKSSSIPLQNELEALRLYVEMELLRFDNKFDFNIDVDESIDKSKIFIPPLIFQPYIENSIWHGLMNKKDRGLINLSIKKLDANKLFCSIEDNGVGREKSAEIKSAKPGTRKSFGMQITRDRISAITDDDKSFSIIDLTDKENNPCGTRVEIVLKYDKQL